jgi:hypothetical protein
MLLFLAADVQVDWQIVGDGYFRFLDGDRQVYSRDGRLATGPQGVLRSRADGLALDPPVHVPSSADRVRIAADGTIFAVSGGLEREVGRLTLVLPAEHGGLPAMGAPGSPGFGVVVASGSQVPSASGAPRLSIPPECNAAGPEIRLGDLATIEGPPERVQALRGVVIGAAPLAGGSRVLSRDQILTKLRAAHIDPTKLHLEMPLTVIVHRPCQEVAVSDLIEAARAALQEQEGVDLTKLSASAGVRHLKAPVGGYELRAGAPVKGGAGWSVAVTAYSGGRPVATTTVRFQAVREQPDETGEVRAGDQVTVQSVSGALLVETTGVVRQRGVVGDQVNVYIPSTKKTVRAEVVDSGTVRVTS